MLKTAIVNFLTRLFRKKPKEQIVSKKTYSTVFSFGGRAFESNSNYDSPIRISDNTPTFDSPSFDFGSSSPSSDPQPSFDFGGGSFGGGGDSGSWGDSSPTSSLSDY